MAQQVKIDFFYRINPSNDKELQRSSNGSSGWSRVCGFNDAHIYDLSVSGDKIIANTSNGTFVREHSGVVHKL